jgi:uncharacterized protein involved in type VI secretion and phage assembly
MTPVKGVVTGLVQSVDDPEGLGRVQLTFPKLDASEPVSNWARIAAPMAGVERGLWFMPEIGDEVLVAFENGDIRQPYVIGFLWNGQDPPPASDAAQRTVRTVSGHEILLDDTAGSEKIAIRFKGDAPSITLDANAIEIRFSDSSAITLSAAELKIVNTTLVNINP